MYMCRNYHWLNTTPATSQSRQRLSEASSQTHKIASRQVPQSHLVHRVRVRVVLGAMGYAETWVICIGTEVVRC